MFRFPYSQAPPTDGIAASVTIAIINYVLLGFQFDVDGVYLHSFEIWLATTVVFFGSGNIGFTLLEYRLGEKSIVSSAVIYGLSCPYTDVWNDPAFAASLLPHQYHVDTFLVRIIFSPPIPYHFGVLTF